MQSSTTSGAGANAATKTTANRMPGQPSEASGADEARQQTMQRAEEMADRLGEQVGQYVSALGHSVLKWVARAREEAEDIWAEAQAIRQRQQSAEGPSDNAPR